MQRVSILIGIGLMLVGALAYAMPVHQNLVALLPALAGVIIALGGIATLTQKKFMEVLMSMNSVIAIILIASSVVAFLGLTPSFKQGDDIVIIVNTEVIVLSAVFLGLTTGLLIRKHRPALI